MGTDLEISAVSERARRECAGLVIDEGAWSEHLRTIVTSENHESLHAGDLLLAVGCARGNADALRIFEERHGAMLIQTVRTVDPGSADDVLQELRRRLFLQDVGGAAPRILGYRGTGPLGGWLRVAALRLAIDLRRRNWRDVPIEEALVPDPGAGTSDHGPNYGSFARENDRAVVLDALRAAIAAQSSRTRTLLRYYYSEHVGVEELGAMYRVHASTVSRWLALARTQIFEATRQGLAEALHATPADVESHLGLAHSLDVSLGSLLRTPKP